MRVNKTLILAVFIAMGLGLQWLQGQSSHSGQQMKKSESFFGFDDFEPFARTADDTAKDSNASPRFAAHRMQRLKGRLVSQNLQLEDGSKAPQENINLGTSPEGATEEGVAAKEKTDEDGENSDEEGDEEKEIIGYDDDGNPIYKEASEDDEDSEESEIIADNKIENSEEKNKDNKDNNPDTSTETSYVTGAAPVEEEKEEDDKAEKDYDQWAQLVLGQANYSEVAKLIEHYQTGRISKDVFYRIVNELLVDSRFEMQKLGVLAVGLTPSRESFLLLADFSTKLSYGSELRGEVDNFLSQYATMAYLHVLESVLMSSGETVSTSAVIIAAAQLDTAARFYMNQAAPNDGNSSQGDPIELTSTQMEFFRFVTILEEFIEFSPDAEARIVAQQTLSSIRSLLEG